MAGADTPLMQQFFEFKAQHPDAILFLRCGDFYEMFHEDARIAARELQVVLTARNKLSEEPIPMAGVPYHAYEDYAARLIQKGYKIAICEQVEDPKQAKGIVKRAVTQVITPGTVTLEGALKPRSNNYLGCLVLEGREYWLATCDVTTGETRVGFFKENLSGRAELLDEILRIRPSELLIPGKLMDLEEFQTSILRILIETGLFLQRLEKPIARKTPLFDNPSCLPRPVLSASGISPKSPARFVLEGLLGYLSDCSLSTAISSLKLYEPSQSLKIDAQSLRNLELIEGLHPDSLALTDVLDKTCSAAGSRLLKAHLMHPLTDIAQISERQQMVRTLRENPQGRQEVRGLLQEVYDLYRLLNRLLNQQGNGRDLNAIGSSLAVISPLKSILSRLELKNLEDLPEPQDIIHLIESAISEDPPPRITEGKLIQKGFDSRLDEILALEEDADQVLRELEEREKAQSGLKGLKLKYNKVFGYYLELPKAQAKDAPEHFIRKQTLTTAERFTTEELKSKETLILSASQKSHSLQYEIFQKIRTEIVESLPLLQAWAAKLAELDVMASHAEVAANLNWIQPHFEENGPIRVLEGRHPVVEHAQKKFTPNDLFLDKEQDQVLLITGPNMGGKSTYLRQAAILSTLAQAGSFVPASSCQLPILDRIFTRIGASDNLSTGKSTFMVEMSETAYLLAHATEKSLILLDEIGRGTATFDGLSLAWAILEYIVTEKKSLCMFATHYHEMTQMSQLYPQVRNCCVEVLERGREIEFLHHIRRGTADRSYGIHVARLAGLPNPVIKQAETILKELEGSRTTVIQLDSDAHRLILKGRQQGLRPLKEPEKHPLEAQLEKLNPDKMSPVEALNALYALKDLNASLKLTEKKEGQNR